MRRSSRRAAAEASIALGGRNAGESNKRPRRTVSRGNAAGVKQEQTDNKPDIRLNHYSSEDIPSAAADPAGITPKSLERVTVSEDVEDTQQGPSAYELARLENIKRNAMVMASLGLSTMSGEMRNSVDAEAAQRARARGLKNSSKKAEKPKLERTRYVLLARWKVVTNVALEGTVFQAEMLLDLFPDVEDISHGTMEPNPMSEGAVLSVRQSMLSFITSRDSLPR